MSARAAGGADRGHSRWVAAALAAAPVAVAALALLHAGAAAAQAEFAYARAPDAVVLSYAEHFGEAEVGDAWVRVTGDGRVRAHFPPGAKRAGDWAGRLSPAELRGLVGSLLATGLVELDPQAVRASRRAAEAAGRARGAPLHARPDAGGFTLELHLARYAPRPGAAARHDVRKRVHWRDLRGDLRRHPDLAALRGLEAARSQLSALLRSPALERASAPEAP